jgi:hypothetical protein
MRASGGVSGRLASGIAILDRWASAQPAYCASYQASNVQPLRAPILRYLGVHLQIMFETSSVYCHNAHSPSGLDSGSLLRSTDKSSDISRMTLAPLTKRLMMA